MSILGCSALKISNASMSAASQCGSVRCQSENSKVTFSGGGGDVGVGGTGVGAGAAGVSSGGGGGGGVAAGAQAANIRASTATVDSHKYILFILIPLLSCGQAAVATAWRRPHHWMRGSPPPCSKSSDLLFSDEDILAGLDHLLLIIQLQPAILPAPSMTAPILGHGLNGISHPPVRRVSFRSHTP